MNTIVPTWIFYLISLLANISTLTTIILVVTGIIAIILLGLGAFYIYDFYGEEDRGYKTGKKLIKVAKRLIIATIISALIVCTVPSKQTMYTMLVNSYVTEDNIESFKGEAKDLVDYIFEKVGEVTESE